MKEALAILNAADAAWLVRLAGGLMIASVCTGTAVPQFQPRVLHIDIHEDPATIAEQLAQASAQQLLQLFALARYEHSARELDPEELLAPFQPDLAPLYEPFAAAVLNRNNSPQRPSEGALIDLMNSAIRVVGYLPFTDLLETTLPTSRQFLKFSEGLAPGQQA